MIYPSPQLHALPTRSSTDLWPQSRRRQGLLPVILNFWSQSPSSPSPSFKRRNMWGSKSCGDLLLLPLVTTGQHCLRVESSWVLDREAATRQCFSVIHSWGFTMNFILQCREIQAQHHSRRLEQWRCRMCQGDEGMGWWDGAMAMNTHQWSPTETRDWNSSEGVTQRTK